jgi:hypothetical protein
MGGPWSLIPEIGVQISGGEQMKWIKNLKVGDEVYTIERHKNLPNGSYKWKSKVIKIEPNYIETVYERDYKLEWLLDLCENLASNHRTFDTQYVKNYFSPDGVINIEEIK